MENWAPMGYEDQWGTGTAGSIRRDELEDWVNIGSSVRGFGMSGTEMRFENAYVFDAVDHGRPGQK
jgi:hypothetical protein